MVVGTALDAGETLVAAAACAAAREAGEEPRAFLAAALGADAEADAALVAGVTGQGDVAAHVLRTSASPSIAAAHHGEAFDPARLVAESRAAAGGGAAAADEDAPAKGGGGGAPFLVASAPGGLLAPLTARYSVRDLARELGLPLVIAAPAGPGLAGSVRLALSAARAAALPVAAVVVTRWPDPPDRVLRDECELLAETTGLELHGLPAARDPAALSEAAARWPVAAWAGTAAPAGAPAGAAPQPEPASADPLALDPYESWRPRNVGDPRGTPRPQIMQALLEIVAAEGPVTASRAYAIYNKASGGKKLTSVARAPLSSAAYWLAREEKLNIAREADIPWQGDDVLRLPDTPEVRVRELGPRILEEVPLDEVAELIRRLRRAQRIDADAELKRAVLATYGLKRLTTRADEYLGLALDLARD